VLNLATQGWLDSTPEEQAAAASSFASYCGRYEVRGDQVVHHVEQSLFPNNFGTSQVRFMKLDSARVVPTDEPFESCRTP
jgi:hypothetical protein